MKYLLDTDHLSILQRRNGAEYGLLAARIAACQADDVVLSVVSFHEQVLGCHTYITRAKTTTDLIRGYGMLGRVMSDFSGGVVLPFDAAAGAIYDSLTKQRIRIGAMDLRIASIALAAGLTLITRNLSDFGQVPGLTTANWTV